VINYRALILCSLFVLGGCTANQREQIEEAKINQAKEDLAEVSDPLEGVNRAMWALNRDVLDKFILKPVTRGYVAITPQPVRTGLLNAANNLEEPSNTINNLLQGKPSDSFASFSRFLINSTVGIFGIIDVAQHIGIDRKEEDFSHVMGAIGIDSGPYLMLPFFGPRDVRGLTGDIIDRFYWPETILDDPSTIAASVVRLLELRAQLLNQEELLERSLDPYLFVRDIYFQRSAFDLSDGKIGQQTEEELQEEADDFADFEALLEGSGP
jgi:phospholipid-binding lipoprotein MlaA